MSAHTASPLIGFIACSGFQAGPTWDGSYHRPPPSCSTATPTCAPRSAWDKTCMPTFPGSSLEMLPGAPHLVSLEQPHEFNDAVRRFARQVIAG
jgi:pimeloyl-ACP methyl ester carboxylesterase